MKLALTLFLGAFAMGCATTSTSESETAVDSAQGYRLICRAPGHPGPTVHVGPCRDSRLASKSDMQAHASAHHGGSLYKMTYTARCELPEESAN